MARTVHEDQSLLAPARDGSVCETYFGGSL